MAKKQPVTRWHNGITPIGELTPNELLAHEMISHRIDLSPSVERIMRAELNEDQRNRALTSFRDALGQHADPNRDPRTAIANALSSP